MNGTNLFLEYDARSSPEKTDDDHSKRTRELDPLGAEKDRDSQQSHKLRALDEDLTRAIAAHRLMLTADQLLRRGLDADLLLLGFSASHIADLRRRAGASGGYPSYSIRNIEQTIEVLREALSRHLRSCEFPTPEPRAPLK